MSKKQSSIDEQIAKAKAELEALPPELRRGNQLEGFDPYDHEVEGEGDEKAGKEANGTLSR